MDINGGAIDVFNHHTRHIFRRPVLTNGPRNEFALSLIEISGTDVFVFSIQRSRDFGNGNAVCSQCVRFKNYLHLWFDTAINF